MLMHPWLMLIGLFNLSIFKHASFMAGVPSLAWDLINFAWIIFWILCFQKKSP